MTGAPTIRQRVPARPRPRGGQARPAPSCRPVQPCRPLLRPPAPARRSAPGPATDGSGPVGDSVDGSVGAPVGDPVSRRARGGLRLTGRGRLLLVLAVTVLLALAFSVGRATTGASDAAGPGPQLRQVVVAPGDTLWSIARTADPGADPRQTVARIIDLNGLSSATVVPGQALRLPVTR